MPIDKEIERITSPDQHNRCQAITAIGQCQVAVTDTTKKFCAMHGGSSNNGKESVRLYQLTKFRARIDAAKSNDEAKTLSEELGILRITLEDFLLKAEMEENGLIINAHPISNLVGQINTTLLTHTKLEAMIGKTINKEEAMAMMDKVIQVIIDHVKDPNDLQIIQQKLMDIIQESEQVSRNRALGEK